MPISMRIKVPQHVRYIPGPGQPKQQLHNVGVGFVIATLFWIIFSSGGVRSDGGVNEL
jgi:hypothetical protein